MMLLVSWKNIWRNKLRSLVLLIAITIGIFAGVFTWAFYKGMVNQRIETAIKTEASHIQLHDSTYLENPEVSRFMPDATKIQENLESMPEVFGTSSRIIASAMILSAETGSGVQMVGIDPEKEKTITDIYTRVKDGKYLEGIKRNPILVGERLATKLNVKLRSKVVLTFQDVEGTIVRNQFRVAGIYKTTNSTYDEMNVFVNKKDLVKMLKMKDKAAHEIAVLLKENTGVENFQSSLQAQYPQYDVKTWRELLPDVSLLEETGDISMYMVMIIVLLALCFGIVNTMLMAVLERIKELGMLMAIGMNKSRVFFMIMFETIFLSVFGAIVGIVLGYIFVFYLYHHGVDLSAWSEGYERLGFAAVVYPVPSWSIAIKVSIMVFFTGLLASIYPAIKALKLNPADAIRIDV